MHSKRVVLISSALAALLPLVLCNAVAGGDRAPAHKSVAMAQVPSWSSDDLDFFLHGSMSTEFIPETVLRAFIRAYPDLFPAADLSHLGLISDAKFGWPVGFSRRQVQHLGGLPAVGVNCASCHVTEITSGRETARVRVLGGASHFDAEAFFGSVIVSMFRTAEPANMQKFLGIWLAESDPKGGDKAQKLFASEWERQKEKIAAAIKADPSGTMDVAPGALHQLKGDELRLSHELLVSGMDLAALAHSTLKLFHNMRAARMAGRLST